jgi:hypothetical protein
VIFGGFGGGITAPLLLGESIEISMQPYRMMPNAGKPPVTLANDICIPLCVIAWYCTQHASINKAFNYAPVKLVIVFACSQLM